MDIDDIERLVRLMKENDLVELEIEREGATVRLRKAQPFPPAGAAPAHAGIAVGGRSPAAAASSPAPASPAPAADSRASGTLEIRSPIVGTFYKSATPESPPFVQVGDRVNAETVVCIIEAMKVMN